MNLLFLIAMLVLTPAAVDGDAADFGTAGFIGPLVAEVESSEHSSTEALISAAQFCETVLSSAKQDRSARGEWDVRYENVDGSVFTRNGILLTHRLADGDFPESCGIVAIPADTYDHIKQAFFEKYRAPALAYNSDSSAKYPPSLIATDKFSYRFGSAARPEAALSIVVRPNGVK